eukprot:SAG11_NODE_1005_length_6207_cov_6.145499_3_plen_622_part_00
MNTMKNRELMRRLLEGRSEAEHIKNDRIEEEVAKTKTSQLAGADAWQATWVHARRNALKEEATRDPEDVEYGKMKDQVRAMPEENLKKVTTPHAFIDGLSPPDNGLESKTSWRAQASAEKVTTAVTMRRVAEEAAAVGAKRREVEWEAVVVCTYLAAVARERSRWRAAVAEVAEAKAAWKLVAEDAAAVGAKWREAEWAAVVCNSLAALVRERSRWRATVAEVAEAKAAWEVWALEMEPRGDEIDAPTMYRPEQEPHTKSFPDMAMGTTCAPRTAILFDGRIAVMKEYDAQESCTVLAIGGLRKVVDGEEVNGGSQRRAPAGQFHIAPRVFGASDDNNIASDRIMAHATDGGLAKHEGDLHDIVQAGTRDKWSSHHVVLAEHGITIYSEEGESITSFVLAAEMCSNLPSAPAIGFTIEGCKPTSNIATDGRVIGCNDGLLEHLIRSVPRKSFASFVSGGDTDDFRADHMDSRIYESDMMIRAGIRDDWPSRLVILDKNGLSIYQSRSAAEPLYVIIPTAVKPSSTMFAKHPFDITFEADRARLPSIRARAPNVAVRDEWIKRVMAWIRTNATQKNPSLGLKTRPSWKHLQRRVDELEEPGPTPDNVMHSISAGLGLEASQS